MTTLWWYRMNFRSSAASRGVCSTGVWGRSPQAKKMIKEGGVGWECGCTNLCGVTVQLLGAGGGWPADGWKVDLAVQDGTTMNE